MQKNNKNNVKNRASGSGRTSDGLNMPGAVALVSALKLATAGQKPPSHFAIEVEGKQGAPPVSNPSAISLMSTGVKFPMYKHPFAGCKTVQITLSAGTFTRNTLLYTLLGNIASGAADGQRTGDVIRIIGYEYRSVVHIGTAASPGADCEYQGILVWSQLPGLGGNQLFNEVGSAYSGLSPVDWDWARVAHRLGHVSGVLDTYHPSAYHTFAKKVNLVVNYDANSVNVAEGQLYVCWICGEDAAAPTTNPTHSGVIQIFYQDV